MKCDGTEDSKSRKMTKGSRNVRRDRRRRKELPECSSSMRARADINNHSCGSSSIREAPSPYNKSPTNSGADQGQQLPEWPPRRSSRLRIKAAAKSGNRFEACSNKIEENILQNPDEQRTCMSWSKNRALKKKREKELNELARSGYKMSCSKMAKRKSVKGKKKSSLTSLRALAGELEPPNGAEYDSGSMHEGISRGWVDLRGLRSEIHKRTLCTSYAIIMLGLMAASASQLRYFLAYSKSHSYPVLNYVLISSCLTIEFILGMVYIALARVSCRECIREKIHSYLLFGLLFIAVGNALIASFSFDDQVCRLLLRTASVEKSISQPIIYPEDDIFDPPIDPDEILSLG